VGTSIGEQRRRLVEQRKDFEVEYRFYSPEEGGRKNSSFYQGYRCDWLYDGDALEEGIWMIWPIFLDDTGSVVDPGSRVANEGKAQMLIVNDELRATLHAKRLNIGVRGYFMEGSQRVAEAIVTKLLAISEVVP